jgi:hypothetical protein
MGAITAGDIAESEAYPERSPSVAAGVITATIGKSGVALKVTY